MKKLIFILVILLSSIFGNAQTKQFVPEGKNSIYADVLILIFINNFQINYERTILTNDIVTMTGRVGVGSWTIWDSNDMSFPSDLHFVFFNSPFHLELNVGCISFYDNTRQSWRGTYMLYGAGLRYQADSRGFFLRVKYEYSSFNEFMPGLSLGFNI